MSKLIAKVGGEPVNEFLLVPFGQVPVERALAGGPFEMTRDKAAQASDAFARSGRALAIDYEHQSFDEFNTRPDGLRPAAGWIGGVEVRGDGLWATRVEWTAKAAEMLRAGEYRYFSPVIYWGDPSQQSISGLGPVALTNDPAMCGVISLVAGARRSVMSMDEPGGLAAAVALLGPRGGDVTTEELLAAVTESNVARVAAALGLDASASIEEVRMKLRHLLSPGAGDSSGGGSGGNRGGGDPGQPGTLPSAQVLAREMGFETGEWSGPTLIAAVRAERSSAKAATDELKKLQTEIGALRDKLADHEYESILSGAAKGKIPPAAREEYRAIFKGNRAHFDAVIAKMPVLAGEQSELQRGNATAAGSDAETDPKRHPYLQAVDAIIARKKCSRMDATSIARREHPDLYREYTGHKP